MSFRFEVEGWRLFLNQVIPFYPSWASPVGVLCTSREDLETLYLCRLLGVFVQQGRFLTGVQPDRSTLAPPARATILCGFGTRSPPGHHRVAVLEIWIKACMF
jgi:hypothetical protein